MNPTTRNRSHVATRSRKLPWIAATMMVFLGAGTPAYAYWAATTSSSNAAATADALSAGLTPNVSANGTSLSVTWAGVTTVNGRAATGYKISRYSAASGGTRIPATGGCAGTVTTLTCTEQNVPGGIWYYTVTPTIALWTGTESPRSTGVSSDSTAPVASVSVSPTPNAAGWNNTSTVNVTVTAVDETAGSGVASISYAVDGGTLQTVSGASATVPVSGDGTHTVSYFATDKAGNTSTTNTQTVKIDTALPSASASVSPTPNAAGWNNTSPVSVTVTAGDGTAGSGVASISYAVDGGPTQTVSGASATIPVSSEGTHSVTYSATDKAGNATSTKTQQVKIDTKAPATKPVTLANGPGGAKVGTVDTGDTVSIPFSEAMDLTKFCPGWTGGLLDGTATMTNGTVDATKDFITFTTSTCPGLSIGTINLGANYVGGTDAVFAGTTNGKKINNPSTLSWDPANNSLVITLGALTSGSVPSPSPDSSPVYTPTSGLADLAGNALPTTPSPLPTASPYTSRF